MWQKSNCYFAAIQQPTAIVSEAMTKFSVTGSPSNRIESRPPMKGARAKALGGDNLHRVAVGNLAGAVVLQSPADDGSEDEQRASREVEGLADATVIKRQQDAGCGDEGNGRPQPTADSLTKEQQGNDGRSYYLEVIQQGGIGCRTALQTVHHEDGRSNVEHFGHHRHHLGQSWYMDAQRHHATDEAQRTLDKGRLKPTDELTVAFRLSNSRTQKQRGKKSPVSTNNI